MFTQQSLQLASSRIKPCLNLLYLKVESQGDGMLRSFPMHRSGNCEKFNGKGLVINMTKSQAGKNLSAKIHDNNIKKKTVRKDIIFWEMVGCYSKTI